MRNVRNDNRSSNHFFKTLVIVHRFLHGHREPNDILILATSVLDASSGRRSEPHIDVAKDATSLLYIIDMALHVFPVLRFQFLQTLCGFDFASLQRFASSVNSAMYTVAANVFISV